jgi:hypothetical protein
MRKMTLLWQDGDRVRNSRTGKLATVQQEPGSSPVLALDNEITIVSGRQEVLEQQGWQRI